jgi:hypothetical protein
MSPEEIKFWRSRIEAADARGYFDYQDDQDASHWNTCAVGEQHMKFPKVVLLEAMWMHPVDRVLERLGSFFGQVVSCSYQTYLKEQGQRDMDWYTPKHDHPILDAYETLDLIEARVMVLAGRARAA